MRWLPLRRLPSFQLTVRYSATDAVAAERAHDQAIAAICEGEGSGENQVCKNAFAATVPNFPAHESTGVKSQDVV